MNARPPLADRLEIDVTVGESSGDGWVGHQFSLGEISTSRPPQLLGAVQSTYGLSHTAAGASMTVEEIALRGAAGSVTKARSPASAPLARPGAVAVARAPMAHELTQKVGKRIASPIAERSAAAGLVIGAFYRRGR